MNNNNTYRRKKALSIRKSAAKMAYNREHPDHINNGDEAKYSGSGKYLASFTKGLPHDQNRGLIEDVKDFEQFVKATNTGNPDDFIKTRLGPDGNCANPNWSHTPNNQNNVKVRAWESQGAGHAFDLEGPDAQAVTMPPAPALGSDELTAEMAEVYSQALLRDVPFVAFTGNNFLAAFTGNNPQGMQQWVGRIDNEIKKLKKLKWFKKNEEICGLDKNASKRRKRLCARFGTRQTAFRGVTKGDDIGFYISQFLLAGNNVLEGSKPEEGHIQYGSIRIDQRVRVAKRGMDYMTQWNEWLNVQNGANVDPNQQNLYVTNKPLFRFITTPRDLATYVHNDALYEAYLNACLLLLSNKSNFDPGLPFQADDCDDHQQGFALFGPPHILTLVTEVATRALKAVRYQKFNIHRRLRPEALAGRLNKFNKINNQEITKMNKELVNSGHFDKSNKLVGGTAQNVLLPMAFPEGSPMHPSYGAGHATVAGACVTILKAFFDHSAPLNITGNNALEAFVPDPNPNTLGTTLISQPLPQALTVEGELNKLASNISIGRNWAGVHYFTDYLESIRMGEKIAIGLLEEQKLTYRENFSLTVPLFDGGARII